MSSAKRSRSRPACVEEFDEDTGHVVDGTARYASSQVPSPRRPQSNIGRTRSDAQGRRPPSVSDYSDDEGGAIIKPSMKPPADRGRPRRPSVKPPGGRPGPPPVIHSASGGPPPDESIYYGVPAHLDKRLPPPQPTPHQRPSPLHHQGPPPQGRSRAQTAAMGGARPPSFHSGEHSRPPPSHSAHFSGQRGGFPPHPMGTPTSFPLPSWHQGGPLPPPQHFPPGHVPQALPAPPPRTPVGAPPEGFPFGPPGPYNPGTVARTRPHSSIGHRQGPSYDFGDAFDHDGINGGPPPLALPAPSPGPPGRRLSVTQQRRKPDRDPRDGLSMPPPSGPFRPQLPPQARSQPPQRPPNAVGFRPSPTDSQPVRRKGVSFSSEDEDDTEPDVDYIDGDEASREYGIQNQREQQYLPAPPPRTNRPPLNRNRRNSVTDRSVSYEQRQSGHRTDVVRSRRRSGMYGASYDQGSEYGDDLDEKMRSMALYTKPHAPPAPSSHNLTRNALRRAGGGGSSRSTRSSDSAVESELPSHTTRTSHSANEDDTPSGMPGGVKIRGATTIVVNGVKVEMQGGEVEIHASKTSEHKGSYRDDASNYGYREDDHRSRYGPGPPASVAARPQLPNRRMSAVHRESFSRSKTAQPQFSQSPFGPPPPGTPSHSHYCGDYVDSPSDYSPAQGVYHPQMDAYHPPPGAYPPTSPGPHYEEQDDYPGPAQQPWGRPYHQ